MTPIPPLNFPGPPESRSSSYLLNIIGNSDSSTSTGCMLTFPDRKERTKSKPSFVERPPLPHPDNHSRYTVWAYHAYYQIRKGFDGWHFQPLQH